MRHVTNSCNIARIFVPPTGLAHFGALCFADINAPNGVLKARDNQATPWARISEVRQLAPKEPNGSHITEVADVHHRILCPNFLSFGRNRNWGIPSPTLESMEGFMITTPETTQRWRVPRSKENDYPEEKAGALFIATGQDAANIAESHAAITYSQHLDNGDFYRSITRPSPIVGTCGGGTGLATQRQCLEMLGCYGEGKARKFAEICAAVVLAGETSLASALVNGDWVTAHERMGSNRPTPEVEDRHDQRP